MSRPRPSTLQRQTDAFRQKVLAMEAESTRLLSATYADALATLEPRILALSKQIEEARANGQEPNLSWLFQQERYQELRRQLITLMDQYGQTAKVITTEAQKVIVREALQHAGNTLLSVSGGSGDEIATLARGWAAVPDSSVIELVGAIQDGTPVDAVIRSYGTDSVQAVQQALTRGLALGDSAQMTTQALRALGVTRARAESLIRTETMRAARAATTAAYVQSGVVKKVRWSAALSERTCGYCLSRHGKLFPVDYVMESHSNCRCSLSPWSPAWDEPWQSGESWLKEQPLTVQQDILGKLGAADFRAGNLQLSDFEKTGFDKDWGPTGHFGGVEWARKQAARRTGTPEIGVVADSPSIQYRTIKTRKEAEAFFGDIGVQVDQWGSQKLAWDAIGKEYAARLNAGLPIESNLSFVPSKTAVMQMRFGFDSTSGRVNRRWLEVNSGPKIKWDGIETLFKQYHDSGYLVGDSLADAITHEIGHADHFRWILPDKYGNGWMTPGGFHVSSGRGWSWDGDAGLFGEEGDARKRIAKTVSKNAADGGPIEYVAEVYTGISKGHEYPQAVMALYEQLGGPPVPKPKRGRKAAA